jgi:predicted DCC family thiol-disulfide oxidoreductase YuxK
MIARDAWTGAQYSLFRAALGLALAAHFLCLLPSGAWLFSREGILPEASLSPLARLVPNVLAVSDSPKVVIALLVVGVAAGLALASGWRDRWAAATGWYVLACLVGRNPLSAHAALPFVGWVLIAHAVAVPAAPYGSWDARGRLDPGGGWRFPPLLSACASLVLAATVAYDGIAGLRTGPEETSGWGLVLLYVEVLYAPLSLVPRLRPWAWLALAVANGGRLLSGDPGPGWGIWALQGFAFDPGWIPRRTFDVPTLVLYDGACGFCQGWVRFLIAEDGDGPAFRFAPLQGEKAHAVLDEAQRRAVGDTVVALVPDGRILSRSDAVIHLGERLGGLWRAAVVILAAVPRGWRDAAYDAVARVRHHLAGRPKDACPILPPPLRARFEA